MFVFVCVCSVVKKNSLRTTYNHNCMFGALNFKTTVKCHCTKQQRQTWKYLGLFRSAILSQLWKKAIVFPLLLYSLLQHNRWPTWKQEPMWIILPRVLTTRFISFRNVYKRQRRLLTAFLGPLTVDECLLQHQARPWHCLPFSIPFCTTSRIACLNNSLGSVMLHNVVN